MNIKEYKQQHPEYNHISDSELADLIHTKYYPKRDKQQFLKDVGMDPTLMETAEGFGANFVSDTETQFGNVYEALSHPIESAKSMYEVASGAIQLLIPGEQVNEDQARAVGKYYKSKYGTIPAFKRALRDTPAEVLTDLGSVFSLGGAGVATLPGKVSKIGQIAGKAGAMMDPISLVGKGVNLTARAGGKLASTGLGTLTGTGSLPLEVAFKANLEGGEKAAQLRKHMRGDDKTGPHLREVVDEGKSRLTEKVLAKQKTYQEQMSAWKDSPTTIPLDDTLSFWQKEVQSMKRGDRWLVNDTTKSKVVGIGKILDEWFADPKSHNAYGFDGLRQRLNDVPIDYANEKRVGRIMTKLKHQLKNKIETDVPEYAKAMKDYAWAADLESQIQSVFSMKHKASTDTIGRKLMSILRSNVNASFDERLALLRQLDESGMMEAKLAGQTLRSLAPQGIMRLGGPAIALGSSAASPMALPAFMLGQSPRAMGEAFAFAGRVASPIMKTKKALGITAELSRNLARTAGMAGRGKEEKRNRKALREDNISYLATQAEPIAPSFKVGN